MSGMAGVVLMHSQIGRDEFGQFCKGCGQHYGYAAERTLHRKASDHVAAMLTAAGFGPVKEAAQVTEAQWQEVAELADPIVVAQPYTQADLREAAAVALEEAADDIRTSSDCGNHYNPSACETCSAVAVLRARAAAVRDES